MRRAIIITLLLASVALAQDGKRPAPPRARAQPLAYSTDADTIRLVPLHPGKLPDLQEGDVLRTTCGVGVDRRRPVHTRWLPSGDLLARRNGKVQLGYARFSRDARGRLRETVVGEWPKGWGDAAAADVDGDGFDDLLLIRKVREGYSDFQYRIARGQEDGTFDFSAKGTVVLKQQWSATFSLDDLDGDGRADLVFHYQSSGGAEPVELFMLAGRGDGTFATQRKSLVKAPQGATTHGIVLEDFNSDGQPDLFLAPDDDVADNGQSYLALGKKDGSLLPARPSVDFVPLDEGRTHDAGSYKAQTCDVDRDGNPDLIVWFYDWRNPKRFTVKVHRGDGRGGFEPGELLLKAEIKGPYKPTMSWRPAG